MRRSNFCVALVLGLCSLAAQAQGVVTVEVFANSAMNITAPANPPYKLTVYRMDGMQRVEQSINSRLPKTEPEARAWMAQNGERIRRETKAQVINAANGITMAQHYHINRLPAVLINRKVVVYGMTDVGAAIERAGGRR